MNGYDKYLKQMENKASHGDKLSFMGKGSQGNKNQKNQIPSSVLRSKNSKKIVKKSKLALSTLVFGIVGFAFSVVGFLNFDEVISWLEKVEFSPMTIVKANSEETRKSEASTEKKIEKQTEKSTDKSTDKSDGDKNSNNVDFNFLKDFQERKKQLDLREEELKRLEAEIELQKNNINKRVEEVENIRKQVSMQLEDRVKADEQKIDTLVQVYSQMKPSQAARVFESIDEDLAVEILSKMKRKNAADILNLVKAEKAQTLSEKYAGYKRKPAQAAEKSKTNP